MNKLDQLKSMAQSAACADSGVYLISPFVGRILDWHLKAGGKSAIEPGQDPGVQSVTQIYNYCKQHDFTTVVMSASFRNTGEIEQFAGRDRSTINLQLMEASVADENLLTRKLDPAHRVGIRDRLSLDEESFRWMMNEDATATEKLAEGIRLFARDQEKPGSRLVA